MSDFTTLERAAMHAIFAESPSLQAQLQDQAEKATITSRENTGGGFFTRISTPPTCGSITSRSPLGGDVYARVDGLKYGMGFLLFLEEGRICLLEGFAFGPENTKPIAFEAVGFEITDGAGLSS